MSTNSQPTIWFHVHIPKTAGSTLRQILSRNFQKSYFSAVSLLEHHKLTLAHTTEIVEKHHRWLRCYSDHRLSLDVPFDSSEIDAKAIAFVRDPVSQVISQYNFQRNHQRRRTEVEEMTIDEFVEKKFARANRNVIAKNGANSNGARNSRGLQLQRLMGREFGSNLSEIKGLLDEGKLYLLPLEEFDLACACLERKFPTEFASAEYILSNRGPKKPQPDVSIENKIREFVAPDFELHNMAKWFLDSLAESVFESPRQQKRSVKDLQYRCQSLQKQMAAA